tara:strand:+ start:388 stop:1380 length:993 start_codon:yes stop_codon:yes gene_type:complete
MENGKIKNLMKFKILPIAGDASFRKFYRIIINNKKKILVTSEREKYKNLIAYSAINKFLRLNKINAPKLYEHNISKGIIIIQDFGDLSFNKVLSKTKNKFTIYKKLVDFLLKIQKIKPNRKVKSLNKRNHFIGKYSNKHLFKESNLFFDWYLCTFLNKEKVLNIKNRSNRILLKLYNSLNFPNSYFCHRDYHADNLMKIGNKIGIIDSQDAIIGNPAYDLVSLIDDVRIKTSYKLKSKVYRYYLQKTFKNNINNQKKFLEDFNILSVQRSLKIIGIFSRLYIRDNKKKYLKLIPYTWKLLEMRMKAEYFLELKKIFKDNIPEKIRKNTEL